MTRRQTYWLLHGGGWGTAVGLLFSLRLLFGGPAQVTALEVFNWLLYWFGGVASTHFLRSRMQRWGWLELPFSQSWYRFAASPVLIGWLLAWQVFLVGGGWQFVLGRRVSFEFLFSVFFNAALLVALWLALYLTAVSLRRYAEAQTRALALELAAKEARLQNLQAQLNPHFLFNSLNSVRALIGEDPAKAAESITWLASLLRYSLRADSRRSVSLREEIDMVTQYLALEQLRFEDRLRVELQVEPAAADALVPPLALQTLVENAIKHGISRLPEGGTVRIGVTSQGGMLEVMIRNTGRLVADGGTGIGLRNTRERLALDYGRAASLDLWEADGEVLARLRLPLRMGEAAA